MDRIDTMRSFVEVGRLGSFSAAARQLGLSRALVSRHILDLERRLEVRLLNRTTRSVTLTEAGNHHFTFCTRVLEQMHAEDTTLRRLREEPEGTLKVIAPMWFSSLDIAGWITDFIATHPRIAVNLVLGGFGSRTFGFLDEGFDVAIYTRKLPASRLKARLLGSIHRTLCASPSYLERASAPRKLDELRQHACLVHRNDMPWRFLTGSRTVLVRTQAALTSNSYLTLRTANLRGLGIAILPSCMVEEDMRLGRLAPVLKQISLPPRPLYAAYSPGGKPPAKVALFIRHLAEKFRSTPL
jgi:DNA-binding transcriptional LysR family regulator